MNTDTYTESIAKLEAMEKEQLIAMAFNQRLNSFMSECSDYKDGEVDPHGHGKRIPYVGWYWRDTDFYNKNISIGDCGSFIGIMENNKWDYPERCLTKEECESVLEIVWKAKKASEQGGSWGDILKNTHQEIDKLWDLFQSFKI